MNSMARLASYVCGTFLIALATSHCCLADTAGTGPAFTLLSFNENWRFHKGDIPGAEKASFDDSTWRSLCLPHDWAIEGPFDKKYNARCGGLPFHGTGWYRKNFPVPADAKGKVTTITFDGAMYNTDVWINGHFLGNRPFGYIEFSYDISDHLNYGGENTIAVKLSPEDFSSRWYPGAGLYRNVWIDFRNTIHVAKWGTFVTTPEVSDETAVLAIETTLEGTLDNRNVEILYEVQGPTGSIVARSEQLAKPVLQTRIEIASPQRWTLENPQCYELITTVREGKQILDSTQTRFGIRTLSFTKSEGFFLNDKPTRIQGVCLHHDNGPLGAVVNRRAIERKLQIMKQMGVNSIRTSHNPPSNELLDLCDTMGLLVQVEAFDVWRKPKVANGYNKFFDEWAERDIKDMVRRDRNHPSVFMWSIGNEILEQGDPKAGNQLASALCSYIKAIDTTRPTTCGFNWWPGPFKNGIAAHVDIPGLNYKPFAYGSPTDEYVPKHPIIGSETSSCTSSRGIYHLPIEKYQTHPSLQVSSYDLICPPWAYPPDFEFDALEKHPEIIGEYVWTGFDYLGEPTPFGGRDNSTNGYWNGDWPSRSSYFGTVDLCGFPKDRYYLYQSQWTTEPMVHVLPHWNWEGAGHDVIPVFAYTNCEEVELFVNGESLGRKIKGQDLTKVPIQLKNYDKDHMLSKYRLSWEVPFSPGSLRVVGYTDGKAVAEKTIQTAGEPTRIRLEPDRLKLNADGSDLSYVTVRVEDKNGNLCPLSDNLIHFEVEGAGKIAAVGNGNAATTEPFIASQRHAFNGLCMLIIQASKETGEISIRATSEGLLPYDTTITAE